MSAMGEVRIGHKAPDFHCEAVIGSVVREVSLSTFLHFPTAADSVELNAPWLLLLFIPAAFSSVYSAEVLAFQNCYEEFQDRDCNIAFVSADTKQCLWYWQNIPRRYGGLGPVNIPLLSDVNGNIGRAYGVFIEEQGVSLRGMFIIDGSGLVQQMTINNLAVGRSVLEALRLLEALQAVAKHGVLCPASWRSDSHALETLKTMSDAVVNSDGEQLASLEKEFGDMQVTDLDAKHRSPADTEHAPHAIYSHAPNLKVSTSAINEFESHNGTRVILEFADAISSPVVSPSLDYARPRLPAAQRASSPPQLRPMTIKKSVPLLSRALSWSGTFGRGGGFPSTPIFKPTVHDGRTSKAEEKMLPETLTSPSKRIARLDTPTICVTQHKESEGNENGRGYFGVTIVEQDEI